MRPPIVVSNCPSLKWYETSDAQRAGKLWPPHGLYVALLWDRPDGSGLHLLLIINGHSSPGPLLYQTTVGSIWWPAGRLIPPGLLAASVGGPLFLSKTSTPFARVPKANRDLGQESSTSCKACPPCDTDRTASRAIVSPSFNHDASLYSTCLAPLLASQPWSAVWWRSPLGPCLSQCAPDPVMLVLLPLCLVLTPLSQQSKSLIDAVTRAKLSDLNVIVGKALRACGLSKPWPGRAPLAKLKPLMQTMRAYSTNPQWVNSLLPATGHVLLSSWPMP